MAKKKYDFVTTIPYMHVLYLAKASTKYKELF